MIVSVPKTGETSGVEQSSSAYTYYCAEEPTSVEPEAGTALIVEPEAMHVLFLRNETLWLRARQKSKSFFPRGRDIGYAMTGLCW